MKINIRSHLVGLFFFLILAISGCQSVPQIHVIKDQSVKFNTYKTYGFYPRLELKGDDYDSATNGYIKAAIKAEMTNKGYRYEDNPDLWLSFNVYVEDKIKIKNVYTAPDYYMYRRGYNVWDDYPYFDERVTQYIEGTLNIDVIDRKTKRLVWEGIAIGKVNQNTYDNLEMKVDEAVRLILAKY
jgi:hypothetical protein